MCKKEWLETEQPPPVGWVSPSDREQPRKVVMKLIVVGDGGVGKTTLIHRYLTGEYMDQRMTVGSGFATRDVVVEGVTITITIWDFAGEERFRFLLPRYCLGSHGCLLAFDLTRPMTFFHLDEWLTLVKENAPNIPILLIGTKLDSAPSHHQPAQQYAESRLLSGFFETSSKDDFNVTETFNSIVNLMWNRLIGEQPSTASTIA